MDVDLSHPVVTGIAGYIGGIVTVWTKGWVQTWVDERKARIENRRTLIRSWRQAIGDFEVWNNGFGSTPEYSSLRAYMRPDVIANFEAPRTFYVGGGRGEDVRKHMLLDEIARIEKEWNLV